MAYDKPNRVKHVSGVFDAGNNGNETFSFYGPKGKAGRLWDYGVEAVTEAFVADCSIAVGDGTDPDAYGEEMAVGALAADEALSVRQQYDPVADASSFDALMVDRDIPADGKVTITVVDDSTSGIGVFWCMVDWDD